MRRFASNLIRLYGHHAPFTRGKFRLALWAYRHLRPLPSPVVTELGNGLKMELDPNEFVQSQIYYLRYYELYLARFFLRIIHPLSVFADVGAHVGQYSLLATERGARVHAFEPNPDNFASLRRNVALNKLTGVALNPLAVTNTTGEAELHLPAGDNTGSGSLRQQTHSSQTVRVRTTTLDAYFAAVAAPPDVIKIDVEGAELLVLRGAQRTLREHRPVLILEASAEALRAFGHEVGALVEFLRSLEYYLYVLDRERLKPLSADLHSHYENLICLPWDKPGLLGATVLAPFKAFTEENLSSKV